MAEKEVFVCPSCGKEYDRETAVHECRVCHRAHCDQCVNEDNVCVPCDEKE